MGDRKKASLRLQFNPQIRLELHGEEPAPELEAVKKELSVWKGARNHNQGFGTDVDLGREGASVGQLDIRLDHKIPTEFLISLVVAQ